MHDLVTTVLIAVAIDAARAEMASVFPGVCFHVATFQPWLIWPLDRHGA
jgi:hypothetical protein